MIQSFVLFCENGMLYLKDTSQPKLKPICVDFVSGSAEYRRKYGGGLSENIAKAVGVTGKYKPYVIDATAGFGRDSFVLASLGCEVLMIERNPMIYELLKDGLVRAKKSAETKEIVERMKLINRDAIDYIKKLRKKPDVIYLDPMFPHSKKSRLVKKEMRILKKLVGNDLDAVELLKTSLTKAKKRVVIKRPARAEFLGKMRLTFQVKGKTGRWDVISIQ